MNLKKYFIVFLLASTTSVSAETTLPGKWYNASQLEQGKRLFAANCAACHGAEGQGLADDWRKPLEDGSYPPPPLNGTAHTWHHPLSSLLNTISNGGAQFGGKMPAFGDKLSEDDKRALIARIHHLWPEDIYKGWIERGGLEN